MMETAPPEDVKAEAATGNTPMMQQR